jgi:hypothetical protein
MNTTLGFKLEAQLRPGRGKNGNSLQESVDGVRVVAIALQRLHPRHDSWRRRRYLLHPCS